MTATSSNHFRESHNLIGSIQQEMPGAKVIIYDLGLIASQVTEVHKMCNVELRPFNFQKYPAHVTPHTLMNYAWKPLIIREVSLEYEIVVWSDTSIRFHASLKKHIFPYFLTTNLTLVGIPFRKSLLSTTKNSHNIAQVTHDASIAYFNLTRTALTRLPPIQCTFLTFWMSNDSVEKVVKEWAECAMHELCIAPEGATVGNFGICKKEFGGPEATHYSGCHRFDQSALNLILYKHYGRGLAEIFDPLAHNTCTINRDDFTQKFTIKQC